MLSEVNGSKNLTFLTTVIVKTKAALFYSPVDSPMHQTCIRVMHI